MFSPFFSTTAERARKDLKNVNISKTRVNTSTEVNWKSDNNKNAILMINSGRKCTNQINQMVN